MQQLEDRTVPGSIPRPLTPPAWQVFVADGHGVIVWELGRAKSRDLETENSSRPNLEGYFCCNLHESLSTCYPAVCADRLGGNGIWIKFMQHKVTNCHNQKLSFRNSEPLREFLIVTNLREFGIRRSSLSKSEIQVRSRPRISDCDKFPKFLGAGWHNNIIVNNQKFSEQLRGFLNSSGRWLFFEDLLVCNM